jgi:hypothetical protein
MQMSGPAPGKTQYKNGLFDFNAPIFIVKKIIEQKTNPVDQLKPDIKHRKNNKKDDMPQRPLRFGGSIGKNRFQIKYDK